MSRTLLDGVCDGSSACLNDRDVGGVVALEYGDDIIADGEEGLVVARELFEELEVLEVKPSQTFQNCGYQS